MQTAMQDDARVSNELVSRAAVIAGDETAWHALYDAAYEPLRTFIVWRLGRQSAVVDEVVQEVWLIAVRRIKDFDPKKGSFIDWMRGIAGNVIRNDSRRSRVLQLDLETLTAGAALAETEPRIEAAERSARIASALSVLPENYAAVLQAKYIEQRSVNDIAHAWNQSTKAIESLLTRARSAFREHFGEEG